MLFHSNLHHLRPVFGCLLFISLLSSGCASSAPAAPSGPAPAVRTALPAASPSALPPTAVPFPTLAPTATLAAPLNQQPATAPPRLAGAEELNLDEKLLSRPGSVTIMWEPEPLLWVNGWCAKDAATLKENLTHLAFAFKLDGEDLSPDRFQQETYHDETQNAECMRYATVLTDWTPGQHLLRMDLTVNSALNDGLTGEQPGHETVTQPGLQTRESLLYVSDPRTEAALAQHAEAWPLIVAEGFSGENPAAEKSSGEDGFQPALTWQTGEFKDEWFTGGAQILDGKYTFTVDEAFKNLAYRHAPAVKVLSGPFEVSVSVQRLSGEAADACAGLYFNYDYETGDFYQFTVCDAGTFAVEVLQNGTWDTLIPWTESTAIHAAEANQLTARVDGSQLTFFINAQPAGEVQDERLYRGNTGIFLKTSRGEKASFSFDDFQLRAP